MFVPRESNLRRSSGPQLSPILSYKPALSMFVTGTTAAFNRGVMKLPPGNPLSRKPRRLVSPNAGTNCCSPALAMQTMSSAHMSICSLPVPAWFSLNMSLVFPDALRSAGDRLSDLLPGRFPSKARCCSLFLEVLQMRTRRTRDISR